MACGVCDGHEPTAGLTQHDRAIDLQGIAERAHVVGPLFGGPGLRRPGIATTAATQVHVDDLGDVAQRGEDRLEASVVGSTGRAVQEDQRRFFAHAGPSGTSFAPSTSKKRPDAVDFDSHDWMNSRGPRRQGGEGARTAQVFVAAILVA